MGKVPKPARYLLRIDDLCPTVNTRRWGRIRDLIGEFAIRPILAVVPANEDPDLMISEPDPTFWDQMRDLEAGGATIALHGYQHLCTSTGESLIGLHCRTEFAGVSPELQRLWIAHGLKILRDHGLNPRLWVAPRHGFDANTLRALREEGIKHLSDGLARIPFRRGEIVWIPQQLWSPTPRSKGTWTICIHPNSTRRSKFEELRAFVSLYAQQFTTFERVVSEFGPVRLGFTERLREIVATRLVVMHRRRRKHASSAA